MNPSSQWLVASGHWSAVTRWSPVGSHGLVEPPYFSGSSHLRSLACSPGELGRTRRRNVGRGGQGLARVAVVVRAGAAPLWWCGVFAAGIGVVLPGITGRRIGVMAGAVLFIVAAVVVAYRRRKRYAELARSAARASKHD